MEDKVLFMIITFITIIRTNITKYTFLLNLVVGSGRDSLSSL